MRMFLYARQCMRAHRTQLIMRLVWHNTTAAEEITGWIFIQQRCVLRIFAAGNQWYVYPVFRMNIVARIAQSTTINYMPLPVFFYLYQAMHASPNHALIPKLLQIVFRVAETQEDFAAVLTQARHETRRILQRVYRLRGRSQGLQAWFFLVHCMCVSVRPRQDRKKSIFKISDQCVV